MGDVALTRTSASVSDGRCFDSDLISFGNPEIGEADLCPNSVRGMSGCGMTAVGRKTDARTCFTDQSFLVFADFELRMT
jgi:hypothetical protein